MSAHDGRRGPVNFTRERRRRTCERLARTAYERTGCRGGVDPRDIAYRLGWLAVANTKSGAQPAELRHGGERLVIWYRFEIDESRCRRNVFFGLATALLQEAGEDRPTYAGLLAHELEVCGLDEGERASLSRFEIIEESVRMAGRTVAAAHRELAQLRVEFKRRA